MRLLPPWQGKPLQEIIGLAREVVEDTDFPTVARWREQGGKVVGHFQVYFPEEIAAAAGMLPVKLKGAPLEARNAGSRFGSYLCSIVKTSLELALSDRLKLDLFVTHPICDAARNQAGVWNRSVPYPVDTLYLPQNASFPGAVGYLRGEYQRIQRGIEEIVGRRVSDDALRSAVAVFNENRRLLRELYRVRRETPWLLATDECYVLMALGAVVERREHNELLKAVLPLVRQRTAPRQDRLRVIFEGGFCEQPPLDLLRALGQLCYVVDDDLLIGLRWITEDVPTLGDPLTNLADAYLNRSSYSPVQHDARKPKEVMLLKRIRESGAEAAIIGGAKMCEPALEEQVAYAKALEEVNVPYFVTEFEETMVSFENLQLQLETFVENVQFADDDDDAAAPAAG